MLTEQGTLFCRKGGLEGLWAWWLTSWLAGLQGYLGHSVQIPAQSRELWPWAGGQPQNKVPWLEGFCDVLEHCIDLNFAWVNFVTSYCKLKERKRLLIKNILHFQLNDIKHNKDYGLADAFSSHWVEWQIGVTWKGQSQTAAAFGVILTFHAENSMSWLNIYQPLLRRHIYKSSVK